MKSSKSYLRRPIETKGLLVVCPSVVIGLAVYRADPKDLPRMLEIVTSSNLIVAIFAITLVIVMSSAAILFKMQRLNYEREITRLADERDKLQAKLMERSDKHD